MELPKPEKRVKKSPTRIAQKSVERPVSVLNDSTAAFAKPPRVIKEKKPIKSKRKPMPFRQPLTDGCCYCCGATVGLEKHEIFFGINHDLSIKYGMVVELCGNSCHRLGPSSVHQNRFVDLALKRFGQECFIRDYPELDFLTIFGQNYL